MIRGYFLLMLALLTESLHHDGKRTFRGKMSPTLSQLRESMEKKISQLRRFVSGKSDPTMTTVAPETTHSTMKGDGVDIIGLYNDDQNLEDNQHEFGELIAGPRSKFTSTTTTTINPSTRGDR